VNDLAAESKIPGQLMTLLHRNSLYVFAFAAAVVVVLGIILPFVQFQLRLSRNGKIAQQLVQSLEERFPAVAFRGGASYEQERIGIRVMSHLDGAGRQEVESWLRTQRIERKIAAEICLDCADDLEKPIIIK
jgi:hypothetical protein